MEQGIIQLPLSENAIVSDVIVEVLTRSSNDIATSVFVTCNNILLDPDYKVTRLAHMGTSENPLVMHSASTCKYHAVLDDTGKRGLVHCSNLYSLL